MPRGASAYSDPMFHLRCDRQAEDILKAFWGELADGQELPPELKGLAEGAQNGSPGVRRSLTMERIGERLRIEVTAVGKGRTQLHLWREGVPTAVPSPSGDAVVQPSAADGLTQREREVALLVADGLTISWFAVELWISRNRKWRK